MNTNLKTVQTPSSSMSSSNGPEIVAYPYQVICEHCQKTVLFSGKNGEVFPVICDQCTGL